MVPQKQNSLRLLILRFRRTQSFREHFSFQILRNNTVTVKKLPNNRGHLFLVLTKRRGHGAFCISPVILSVTYTRFEGAGES